MSVVTQMSQYKRFASKKLNVGSFRTVYNSQDRNMAENIYLLYAAKHRFLQFSFFSLKKPSEIRILLDVKGNILSLKLEFEI